MLPTTTRTRTYAFITAAAPLSVGSDEPFADVDVPMKVLDLDAIATDHDGQPVEFDVALDIPRIGTHASRSTPPPRPRSIRRCTSRWAICLAGTGPSERASTARSSKPSTRPFLAAAEA
jgi:hypothetical protein